jgi:hypothetical protein
MVAAIIKALDMGNFDAMIRRRIAAIGSFADQGPPETAIPRLHADRANLEFAQGAAKGLLVIGDAVRGKRFGRGPAFGNPNKVGIDRVEREIIEVAALFRRSLSHVRDKQVAELGAFSLGGLDMSHYNDRHCQFRNVRRLLTANRIVARLPR